MHGPRTSARRPRTIPIWVVGIGLGLLALPSAFGGPGPIGPATGSPLPAMAGPSSGSNPCPGAAVSALYPGQIADAGGGASAPPLANQSVVLSYRYTQTFNAYSGGPAQYACLSAKASAFSNSQGAFSVTATMNPRFCERAYGCWNFSGPYGPVSLSLGNGSLPAGYYSSETVSSGSYVLTRVYALESTELTPSGFTTVSLDAPSTLVARPLSGLGTPSPASVSYAWTLEGTGWRALNGSHLADFTVEAVSTTYVATAEVWANGTYEGVSEDAPPVSVLLTAAATTIERGSVFPTSVDVAIPTTFTWTGTGAAGYPYTATLWPGISLPEVAATCQNHSIAGGLVELDCSATYEYGSRGSAQPSATLANPYSSANYSFAPVTISLGLAVVVTPDPVVEYPGIPIAFRIAIGSGTGTTPYGPACLSDGLGTTVCQNDTRGPPWSFNATYPSAGTYHASISVADSGGTNYTSGIPVSIVGPLAADPLGLPTEKVRVGGPLTVGTVVRGGAFPIAYWWNVSYGAAGSTTVGSGRIMRDGAFNGTLTADATGNGLVSLRLVDALGTQVTVTAGFDVVSANATEIVRFGPPSASGRAGAPLDLSFLAEDALQDPVTDYAASFRVLPEASAPGSVWINASGDVPIEPSAGAYVLPASAWQSGYLNLTFTTTAAGAVNLTFTTATGIPGPSPLRVDVGADLGAELLADPQVAHPGARANATLYEIQDQFGNPVPAGQWVLVRSVFGSAVADVESPIHRSGAISVVWVNYSAIGSGAGTVLVLSEANQTLLPPITVPALSPTPFDLLAYALIGVAATAAAVGAAVLARRRRPGPSEGPEPDRNFGVEEGLKRLAEGRAHVLARVPPDSPVDLDHIAEGWTGTPPDAAELAEWVGSLVSEGVLRASIGPEGRPMFVRVSSSEPPSPPRVEVDSLALEAALARQQAEAEDAPLPKDGEGERADGPA